jgi:hypothetical protein
VTLANPGGELLVVGVDEHHVLGFEFGEGIADRRQLIGIADRGLRGGDRRGVR